MPELLRLHPVNRAHLEAMTDEVGIMQHAIGSKPDPAHGYCTDDVARALQVDLLHQRELGWPAVADSAWRNVRFLTEAFDGGSGRFRNFRLIGGSWAEGAGSEDCHGRAMLALGETLARSNDLQMQASAGRLFEAALPRTLDFGHVRPWAYMVLGCDAALRGTRSPLARDILENLAVRLAADVPRGSSRDAAEWPWPEPVATYDNGVLPQALIVAGRRLRRSDWVDLGLRSLRWLQTAPEGHLTPVGNRGWWPRGGTPARVDQQPIEAVSLLEAARSAYEATEDPAWAGAMESAFGWFLGANDLGIALADPERGACRDGLGVDGPNGNKGAESTLAWLLVVERIRALRCGSRS